VSSSVGLSSLLPFQWSLGTCVCYYGPLRILLEGGKVQQQTKQLEGEKYGESGLSQPVFSGMGSEMGPAGPTGSSPPSPSYPAWTKGSLVPKIPPRIPWFYTFSLRAEVSVLFSVQFLEAKHLLETFFLMCQPHRAKGSLSQGLNETSQVGETLDLPRHANVCTACHTNTIHKPEARASAGSRTQV